MYSKIAAEQRDAQLTLIAALVEPFTPAQYALATGKPTRSAMSQMRRWMDWGWIEKIGPSQYARTDAYGKDSASHVGRGKQPKAPVTELGQERVMLPKLPDTEGEGKDEEWIKANYKRFDIQSKWYKKGWFLANKHRTKNYWKKRTSAARTALAAKQASLARNGSHVPQQTSEVVSCKLTECPNCGTRFYMAKGGAA